jgi:AcrR family transcriptional regulator
MERTLHDRRTTPSELRDAAVKLISLNGMADFKVRDVAAELGIAKTLPLYYFGTLPGLLGAVAEASFKELAKHLQMARRGGRNPLKRLEQVALAHGQYGLENSNLYKAIHSQTLWERAARSESGSPAHRRAAAFIERARKARDKAFLEYVDAVVEAQESGSLQGTRSGKKIAHMLSALVDGFLFQTREERVQAESSAETRLSYLGSLVRLALHGSRI